MEDVVDVLFVPVHAIHRTGAIVWVWVQDGGGFSQREVSLGRFSESYAEILSGCVTGDVVLLREPHPSQVVGVIQTETEK